jgi:ribosome-interacting GTPase 1
MMKCRGMGKAMKPVALKKGGTVKDACYKKVKASYKVFPSAYASGAIAKCRKNKGKK